jgi:hypothetical protein
MRTQKKGHEIPIARLIPSPPLFFEKTESARKVRIMIETGIEVL